MPVLMDSSEVPGWQNLVTEYSWSQSQTVKWGMNYILDSLYSTQNISSMNERSGQYPQDHEVFRVSGHWGVTRPSAVGIQRQLQATYLDPRELRK